MKKFNLISTIAILLAFLGLVLLRVTGINGHMAISFVALATMVICVVVDRKNWKKPALEVAYRVLFLVALVTGFLMTKAGLGGAVVIAHKASAALFAIVYVVNLIASKK